MIVKRIYLVFDIGGTFTKWAIIDSNYRIIKNDKFAFNGKENDGKKLLQMIGEIIINLSNEYKIDSIGISTAGIVDPKTSKMLEVTNIKNFKNLIIKNEINKFTKKKVFVENDANAATIGETTEKSIKKYNNVLMMTLGTDIGGGIIINKKIYQGNGMAGEIGHQIIDGKRWGEYYSSQGLIKLVKLENNVKMTTYEILESKDSKIKKTIDNWYKGIANGIANLIVSMNFEAIIIGGGISESNKFSLEKIQKYVDKFLNNHQFISSYKLYKAQKGNNAAIIGMAKVINENL